MQSLVGYKIFGVGSEISSSPCCVSVHSISDSPGSTCIISLSNSVFENGSPTLRSHRLWNVNMKSMYLTSDVIVRQISLIVVVEGDLMSRM